MRALNSIPYNYYRPAHDERHPRKLRYGDLHILDYGSFPQEAAAHNSFVPSLLTALVGTGSICLALATGGHGIGQTTAMKRNVCVAGVDASNQAAIELQVSFVMLL